jgi:hypothetical protein
MTLGRFAAAYGEQILHALSGQWSEEYGPGFGSTNIFNTIRLPARIRTAVVAVGMWEFHCGPPDFYSRISARNRLFPR